MSDSEDEEVQSKSVKITVVGEPSTGKVSTLYFVNFINSYELSSLFRKLFSYSTIYFKINYFVKAFLPTY